MIPTISTVTFLLLLPSVILCAASIAQQVENGTDVLLCDYALFNQQVRKPTRERSSALLQQAVLQDIDTGKVQELNTLNVTDRVCGDLAAHMTERRLGRNTLGHRILSDARLIYGVLGNSTQQQQQQCAGSAAPNTENAALSFLHNYCLYWFGQSQADKQPRLGIVREIWELVTRQQGPCPAQTQ